MNAVDHRRRQRVILSTTFVLAALSPQSFVMAEERTIVMRGQVDVIDELNLLPPVVADGAPFELRLTYDTSVADSLPDLPLSGEYRHFPDPRGQEYAFGLSVNIAGALFQAVRTEPNAFVLTVQNDIGPPIPGGMPLGDGMQLLGTKYVGPVVPGPSDDIYVRLQDRDGAVFESDSLPLAFDGYHFDAFDPLRSPFDVSNPAIDEIQFVMTGGSLAIVGDDFYFYQIAGRGVEVFVVPEPNSRILTITLIGIVFLLFRFSVRDVAIKKGILGDTLPERIALSSPSGM